MAERPNPVGVSEADMLPCDQCGRKFVNAQGLALHKTRKHGKKRDVRSHPHDRVIEKMNGPRRDDQVPVFEKEEKPEALRYSLEAQIENEAGLLGMIELTEYQDAVREFLPHLARECDRRELNSNLVSAFMTLFIDVN